MREKLTDTEFSELARKIMFEVRLDDQGRQAAEALEQAECIRKRREQDAWLQIASNLNLPNTFGS